MQELVSECRRWLVRTVTASRSRRRQQRELRLLDQAALRDLGVDRSEFGSYDAEEAGVAGHTRRRVSGREIGRDPKQPPCAAEVFPHTFDHTVPAYLSVSPFTSMETVMPKFVIERPIPGIGASNAAELQTISQKSCSVLQELGTDVQWVHSYVTTDKIYCVYNAETEGLVREHARRSGFPATSVARVAAIIDPTTAEA